MVQTTSTKFGMQATFNSIYRMQNKYLYNYTHSFLIFPMSCAITSVVVVVVVVVVVIIIIIIIIIIWDALFWRRTNI